MSESATASSETSVVSDADTTTESDGFGSADAARELAYLAGVLVWLAFWVNVTRLLYVKETTLDAGFAAVVLVAPVAVGYLWHVVSAAGLDEAAAGVGSDSSEASSN